MACTSLTDICTKLRIMEEESKKQLPKLLVAKKAMYLKAINKPELIDFDYTESDANIKNSYPWTSRLNNDLQFDDSIVIDTFKNYAKPTHSFETYLNCVKLMLEDYLCIAKIPYYECVVYTIILANARDFDDPSKDMFEYENGSSEQLPSPDFKGIKRVLVISNPNYRTTMLDLISDLRKTYNEQKYQILNINATYLLLVAVGGMVKGRKEMLSAFDNNAVQQTYDELCPLRLKYKFPTMSEKCSMFNIRSDTTLYKTQFVTMILYAYKTKQNLTRSILAATCLKYFKYNGQQMYTNFERVLELYDTNESKLWDCFVNAAETLDDTTTVSGSLISLADFHHKKREGETAGKTYDLLPYCRVLNGKFHMNLSAKQNLNVTYALATLVDTKLGVENSSFTKAAWANQGDNMWFKKKGEKLALLVKEMLEKN